MRPLGPLVAGLGPFAGVIVRGDGSLRFALDAWAIAPRARAFMAAAGSSVAVAASSSAAPQLTWIWSPAMPLRIDTMNEDDVAAVVSIDGPTRMSEEQLRAEIQRPWARLWVARDERVVVAFVIAWHVADELHVLNVATREDRRRRGHRAAADGPCGRACARRRA